MEAIYCCSHFRKINLPHRLGNIFFANEVLPSTCKCTAKASTKKKKKKTLYLHLPLPLPIYLYALLLQILQNSFPFFIFLFIPSMESDFISASTKILMAKSSIFGGQWLTLIWLQYFIVFDMIHDSLLLKYFSCMIFQAPLCLNFPPTFLVIPIPLLCFPDLFTLECTEIHSSTRT